MNLEKNDFFSVVRNTFYLTTKSVIVYLLRLVYVAMCARLLGPELYGLLIYGHTWYLLFLPFGLMGLQPAISRMVGLDRSKARDITKQTLSFRLLSALFSVSVCVLLASIVADDGDERKIIYIFSFALAGRALAQWTNEIFNAFEISVYTLRLESVFRLSELIAGLILLLSGGGVLYLAMLHGSVWWLQAASGLYMVNMKCERLHLEFSLSRLKPVFLMAIPFLVGSLLATWGVQGPIILFRHLLDDKALAGEFALLMQILIILSSIYISVTIAAIPVLSRSADSGDGKDLRFIDMLVRSTFILGALLAMTGAALGPTIIPEIFGDRYALSAVYLGMVLWCILPLAIAKAMTSCAIARGHFYIAPICYAAGAYVMTASMYFFAYRWGIMGGVASAGLGLSVAAFMFVVYGIKHNWLDARRTIIVPILAVLLAQISYAMATSISGWAAYLSGVAVLLAVSFLSGALSYDDVEVIRRTLRKRKG